MRIRQTDSTDSRLWDDFVQNHLHAAPYHLMAWKKAVEEAYGHKGYYLIAEKGGVIRGALPLIHMKLPWRSRIVSLPFCDSAGPIAANQDTEIRLLEETEKLAEKTGCHKVEIRERNRNEYSADKVSMLLDLPGSSEKLWKSLRGKVRNQVKKAEKNGLTFSWGNRDKVNDFYYVFCRNMHNLGSPVHSRKWIRKILEHYGENARLGLVYFGDQPVGCGIILCTRFSASIPWASTLREYNRLKPGMLLYWNLLKFCADNDFNNFDFGRSTPGEGTYRFKAQWGAKPVPLKWYGFSSEEPGRETGSTSSMDFRKLSEQCWQKTPLAVANFCGPLIRKHISL